MDDHSHTEGTNHPHSITIHIDRKMYKAPKTPMTGAELKTLAGIVGDFDLYFDTPGSQDDVRLKDDEPFPVEPGNKFYSVPRHINPGS